VPQRRQPPATTTTRRSGAAKTNGVGVVAAAAELDRNAQRHVEFRRCRRVDAASIGVAAAGGERTVSASRVALSAVRSRAPRSYRQLIPPLKKHRRDTATQPETQTLGVLAHVPSPSST